ncbi:hypothetical protein FQR65_LT19520 [Abscondita terminalis]|nr:hypothetical protein FQR65_LT19520 [Abscondita terminalis]
MKRGRSFKVNPELLLQLIDEEKNKVFIDGEVAKPSAEMNSQSLKGFKIVQTIEKGALLLSVVPSKWENNGKLWYPPSKMSSRKLFQNCTQPPGTDENLYEQPVQDKARSGRETLKKLPSIELTIVECQTKHSAAMDSIIKTQERILNTISTSLLSLPSLINDGANNFVPISTIEQLESFDENLKNTDFVEAMGLMSNSKRRSYSTPVRVSRTKNRTFSSAKRRKEMSTYNYDISDGSNTEEDEGDINGQIVGLTKLTQLENYKNLETTNEDFKILFTIYQAFTSSSSSSEKLWTPISVKTILAKDTNRMASEDSVIQEQVPHDG